MHLHIEDMTFELVHLHIQCTTKLKSLFFNSFLKLDWN
jgi:hypothetical protein